jgi:hypothetical protein
MVLFAGSAIGPLDRDGEGVSGAKPGVYELEVAGPVRAVT